MSRGGHPAWRGFLRTITASAPDFGVEIIPAPVNNAALADAKVKARLADVAYTPVPTTLADFEKFIADETDKWAKVIRTAGIKLE